MSTRSRNTGVELRGMELNVLRINSTIMGLAIAFVLIQSLMISPIVVLSFPQYVALGIALFLLKEYVGVWRQHSISKFLSLFQMKFLHYVSQIGLSLTIMAALSFSDFHPIVGVVSISLLVPYLCLNVYISRSIQGRYYLTQDSSERSC